MKTVILPLPNHGFLPDDLMYYSLTECVSKLNIQSIVSMLVIFLLLLK